MERAKSAAWMAVAALTVLFLIATALLWSGTRTTSAQENARAAQAAGVSAEHGKAASGSSAEHGTDSGKAEAESTTAKEGEQKDSDQPGTSQGNAEGGTDDGALAGATSASEEDETAAPTVHPAFDLQGGEELYAAACRSCHMPGGVGADGGAGTKNYPALAGNQNLQAAVYPATFILNGAGGMPSFADQLTDEQVAAIINYLRNDLNNFEGEITPAEIAPLRGGARSTDLGDDAG